jgi:hypothetical protein
MRDSGCFSKIDRFDEKLVQGFDLVMDSIFLRDFRCN